MQSRSLIAFNTATASANKIHDDAVAGGLGFRGGLVPGVDVYAYLTHLPAARWGREWLEQGSMAARFAQPVYDGDVTEVVATTERPDGAFELEVRTGSGVCATAVAQPPGDRIPEIDFGRWPACEQSTEPPPATPETLVPGTAFALAPHGFHADRAGEYLDDVREDLAIYRDTAVAHPGWLLRDANYVLSANVRLGPWIHVGSDVQHLDVVHDGAVVSARALVTGEWERSGHRFVTLDVLHLAGDQPVARTMHTAIYRPRGT